MTDFRRRTIEQLDAMLLRDGSDFSRSVFGTNATMLVSEPIGELTGQESIVDNFYEPLRSSLNQVKRRNEIVIGGQNKRDIGGYWVAILCHYVGTFVSPLWGILPSDCLVFLRAGEFYSINENGISQARIILDLPDLMRQSGRKVFSEKLGTEMLFPSPATHDGVLPRGNNGDASIALVERMLTDLRDYDRDAFAVPDQTGDDGYWHPDLLWYGPGGIGSTYRWRGFVKDHGHPFLKAFPDRIGGNHFCRIGDGDYAAIAGWPSMTMTHVRPYLGVPATQKPISLRVMDFYRCSNGRIAENWVMLDYIDLFAQMGVDLIERAHKDLTL